MNRDELHSRGEALPPRVVAAGGVRRLAPVDSDAGGSWIATNDHGLTVCLLNHYPSPALPESRTRRGGAGFESRGTLVLDLAALATVDEADRLFEARDLATYRPFTVMLFPPHAPPRLRRWGGASPLERVDSPLAPVSSSSFDSRAVVSARTAAYRRLVGDDPDPERLLEYHRSHLPERGPYSVCTHREDGGTKSLTRVAVDVASVTMRHLPGPPCDGAPAVVRSLGRADA